MALQTAELELQTKVHEDFTIRAFYWLKVPRYNTGTFTLKTLLRQAKRQGHLKTVSRLREPSFEAVQKSTEIITA